MAVDAGTLRDYLRLPPDDGENLNRFLEAARAKARAAGIPDFRHNALYDQFLLALAAMYYENRGMTFSGSYQATAEANARALINSYVLELRYARDEPEGGGGEDG